MTVNNPKPGMSDVKPSSISAHMMWECQVLVMLVRPIMIHKHSMLCWASSISQPYRQTVSASTTDLHQCSTVVMATTFTCFTGAVHLHSTKQEAASQQRALHRKPVLTCRSTQSSFRGTQLVQRSRCACLSRTKVRSSPGISITAEQSYIMIKPDGVQRALVGQIINRFERKGFTLKALKMFTPSKQLAEEHYKDLSSKPFFGKLVDYIISGPVIAMVSHHKAW